MLGVIGESGFGKRTLGGLVTGLIAPDIGALHFDGLPCAGRAAACSVGQRRRMAGRVAVMRGGRILEKGETALMLRAPVNPYTATLLGAATRASRVVEPVPAAK